MEKYSKKLKQILTATGWSQEILAGKLGVSFVTLNSWVNEKSEPREGVRGKIEAIFADVMGSEAVDVKELAELKRRAVAQRYSAKRLANDRQLLERLTTSLTYHSNGTEGSTMTEQDVAAVVYGNQTLRNRTATEQREAINHQTALYFLLDVLAEAGRDFQFTPDLVKSTHLRMMNGVISDAGYYRNHAVRIRGANVALANYLKVPELVQSWCNLTNSETTDKIGLMARAHAEFERIHPFTDGNGRTGRLLLFALALKLETVPPILKKERRFAYYKYLELAQTREQTDPLEMLIAQAMLETAEEIMG
ncbi:Fic family protein [Candidatus Saccharibacteria bacterium]|nr:Fic family protein [Candidatus Saccharibacteria bacterium]